MANTKSVFLCHSSRDKAFVRLLSGRLRTFGVKVWLDEAEMSIGDSLTAKIGDALDSVDYVAIVLSNQSVNSEWVKRELRVALHREFEEGKVVVLPIMLDKVRMPPFLRDKLYADFTSRDAFERNFGSLLQVLGVTQEHVLTLQDSNFQFQVLHHSLTIHDTQGHRATWLKKITLTPLKPGIKMFRDGQFHGTGKFRFIKSTPGEIVQVNKDGGTFSIITAFSPPLEEGKALTRTLEVEAIDCFLDPDEDFSWIPQSAFEKLIVELALPKERPFASEPIASFLLDSQEQVIPLNCLSFNDMTAVFVISKPIVGAKYILRWTW